MKNTHASLAILAACTACTVVAPVQSPFKYVAGQQPQRIWITRTDGSTMAVNAPRVAGDTLFGFEGVKFHEIPLETIYQVRAVQSAPTRTAGLAIGLGIVAVGAYLEMNSKGSPTQVNCTGNEEDIC